MLMMDLILDWLRQYIFNHSDAMAENQVKLPLLAKSNLKSTNLVSNLVRRGGIRLEEQVIAGKRFFHDYGMGEDQSLLAFASAEIAARMLRRRVDGKLLECAVVGRGVAALLTALELIKAGQRVTVYSQPSQNRQQLPKVFLPMGYDWEADPLKHQLFSKVSYQYLLESVRISRYQGIRSIKAFDLGQRVDDLKVAVSAEVASSFREGCLLIEGGQVQPVTSYTTILVDSQVLLEELRVEAVLRGVKFEERKLSSLEDVMQLKEDYIFNCRGDLLGETEMKSQNRLLLQFEAHPSQEEFMLSFRDGEGRGNFQLYCLSKKTYLVGPASTSNLKQVASEAIRALSLLVQTRPTPKPSL